MCRYGSKMCSLVVVIPTNRHTNWTINGRNGSEGDKQMQMEIAVFHFIRAPDTICHCFTVEYHLHLMNMLLKSNRWIYGLKFISGDWTLSNEFQMTRWAICI